MNQGKYICMLLWIGMYCITYIHDWGVKTIGLYNSFQYWLFCHCKILNGIHIIRVNCTDYGRCSAQYHASTCMHREISCFVQFCSTCLIF